MALITPPSEIEYPTPAGRAFAWIHALEVEPNDEQDCYAAASALALVLSNDEQSKALIEILTDACVGTLLTLRCTTEDCGCDGRFRLGGGFYNRATGRIDSAEVAFEVEPVLVAVTQAVDAAARAQSAEVEAWMGRLDPDTPTADVIATFRRIYQQLLALQIRQGQERNRS